MLESPSPSLPPPNYGWFRKFVDIDGDALPDKIVRTLDSDPDKNQFVVRPSRTGGMANFGGMHSDTLSWAPIYDTPPAEEAPRSPAFLHWSGPEGYVTTIIDLLDINGDGYLDRVARASLTSPLTNFVVRLGTGLGFDPAVDWGGLINPTVGPIPISRWACPTASNNEDQSARTYVTLTDMNADGLPDRVMRKPLEPYVYYSVQLNNGWTFDPPLTWTNVQRNGWSESFYGSVASPGAALIDLNGDGLPDRVLRKPSVRAERLESPRCDATRRAGAYVRAVVECRRPRRTAGVRAKPLNPRIAAALPHVSIIIEHAGRYLRYDRAAFRARTREWQVNPSGGQRCSS